MSHYCLYCGSRLVQQKGIMSEYALCNNDELIHYLGASAVEYEDDYFNREYRQQYGRTYSEDKANIQKQMKKRLNLLKTVTDTKGKKLLEIGSAAGYFLELAEADGMQAEGWEISESMSTQARQNGLKTLTGDFFSLYENLNRSENFQQSDILAVFYVLEHFQNQRLFWRAAADLLTDNGFLLIALPSTFGPVYHFNRRVWVDTHPADHFVDYSPRALELVARQSGFRMISHVPESLHPERFLFGDVPVIRDIYSMYQKMTVFSDTFMAVLQKKGSQHYD